MPRIRCHYSDCVFLDENYCGAAAVELDPDMGCQTYSQADDSNEDSDWDDDEEELEEWDDDDDVDDEIWLDDDDY